MKLATNVKMCIGLLHGNAHLTQVFFYLEIRLGVVLVFIFFKLLQLEKQLDSHCLVLVVLRGIRGKHCLVFLVVF